MPDVLAVIGPTAAGKTHAALEIAVALGGEIVNADSMQLYRGMDIGTAKLPPDERRGVPHHLLDVWDVTRRASVADYQALARAAIDDIRARGRLPVLVGGSGLYLRAALDRLEFPGTDVGARQRLEDELAAAGAPALHARLAVLDPVAASRILPSNGRRIVRALEVIELTGAPYSAAPGMTAYESEYETAYVGIAPPMPELDQRIEDRVAEMWRAGFVDEVRALLAAGIRDGVTASRALGYQQVLAFLDGATDEPAARAATIVATRQFARRQLKWFRRDPRVSWQPGPDDAIRAALAAMG